MFAAIVTFLTTTDVGNTIVLGAIGLVGGLFTRKKIVDARKVMLGTLWAKWFLAVKRQGAHKGWTKEQMRAEFYKGVNAELVNGGHKPMSGMEGGLAGVFITRSAWDSKGQG